MKEEIVAVDKRKLSESSNTEQWTNLNDNNFHHDLKDGNGDGDGDGDGGDSSSNGCCSQTFKTCASWGNESKDVCDSYGSMIWLEEGALGDDVCTLMKDASCRNNPDGCCPGLVCEGTQYYKQCKMSANTE